MFEKQTVQRVNDFLEAFPDHTLEVGSYKNITVTFLSTFINKTIKQLVSNSHLMFVEAIKNIWITVISAKWSQSMRLSKQVSQKPDCTATEYG